MPCYLITWHAYGSWLPDRSQGHVHWRRGREGQSVALAGCYRHQQKETTVAFGEEQQRALIDQLTEGSQQIRARLHAVACDPSHVHVLVSWRDDRSAKSLRRSLRRALTTRLNAFEKRTWFSRGESVRRVKDQEHFDHLRGNYLPSHRGWKWGEGRGPYP